jgi:hypothetical protein
MGQRHQIFLNVPNPRKILREDKSDDSGFKQFHHSKRTVILPFHNQWLYGRRAPLSALRVLSHSSLFSRFEMLGNAGERFRMTHSPFTVMGIKYSEYEDVIGYAKEVENLLNYEWNGEFIDIEGVGRVSRSWMEGVGDKKEYNKVSEAFDMGDNNDGITIIDTITNKYCFMNISSYEVDELTNSVLDLKPYTPVSAREYMKAYYGETPDTINTYYVTEDNTAEDVAKRNKLDNEHIDKYFKDFEVLTLDEISKMFPKMELTKKV